MKNWLKTGIISCFIAFLLSLIIFSGSSYNPAYSLFGKLMQGVRVFYALIFVCISFFTGIIVGALREKSRDKLDYYSKIFVIIFNGMAFFIVIGFGFSLQVWQVSFSNNYTWISVFAFIVIGLIVMPFVYFLAKKRIRPKNWRKKLRNS